MESQTPDSKPLPIFFDPSRARWRRIRNALLVVAGLVSILGGALVVSVLFPSLLPDLGLRPTAQLRSGPRLAPRKATAVPKSSAFGTQQAKRTHPANRKAAAPRTSKGSSAFGTPLTVGYYVNWDDSSFSSLKANLPALDLLVPEWLHIRGPNGKVEEDDPEVQTDVLAFIREQHSSLRIMPLVNNYDDQAKGFDADNLARVLANDKLRASAIDQLVKYVRDHACAGLTIDFESLPPASQPAFHRFLKELGTRLHAAKLSLAVSLQAEEAETEFARIAESCDYVIVLAFDQHWEKGPSGPLAGADWFREILERLSREIPPEKLVWAIGNYGYDWSAGQETASKTFDEVMLTARENNAKVVLDKESLNPTFTYQDAERRLHTVWFLDAVTAFNQLALAGASPPRGFAVWRLGSEDPSLWNVLGKKNLAPAAAVSTLKSIVFKQRRNFMGEGDIYKVMANHRDGRRDVSYNPARGLIAEERYVDLPTPCMIQRYTTNERKIALTFDDGPDPKHTPFILDILRRKHAHATFFIVGSNGERYPELVEREVEDHHEVGNHTYTHPQIFTITPTQIRLEVSATERLLQAATGRQAVLFRAPYGADLDPSTMEDTKPLELVAEMGYVTVGWNIDPEDWDTPGVDEILRRVIDGTRQSKSHIVLLHDAGGDRSQTVQALPILIDRLRALGYQLVTVSELMGRTRDEVMPPLTGQKKLSAAVNWQTFRLMNATSKVLTALFLGSTVLGLARLIVIGVLAVVDKRRSRRRADLPGFLPDVAVIVPAYNEEKVIVQTVASLLTSTYRGKLEIVVVDDGSGDNTYDCALTAFAGEPRVRIFRKINGGKSAALNFGLRLVSAPIVVTLDADTIFRGDTVDQLVRHFADEHVGAVAGNAKVGNRINVLTRWQALEYVTSQNLDRRAFNLLNCITVVPGAVGAWRRDLIEELGGFNPLTLAEDADLTIAIGKAGYRVLYDEDAVALTEAPDTVRAFVRQRFRWMFGTAQAAWKHRDCFLKPRYGAMGLVGLPNIVLFQVIFPLVAPLLDATLLFSLITALVQLWQNPGPEATQSLTATLPYYLFFTAVDFLTAALAFRMEPAEDKRLLVWLIPQRFVYRQLMYYVAIKSALAAMRGFEVGWGTLERKATVTPMPELFATDSTFAAVADLGPQASRRRHYRSDRAAQTIGSSVQAEHEDEEPTLSAEPG